jgi:4-amino-4-deoxy-L-arabinose transferase-like glycosyltransferase
MPNVVISGAVVVGGVLTVLRIIAAFNVPLSGDEAYYWTWSLHPAFGYTDHPPMVAWLIWLGRSLGAGAGFVRLPFVLCEALAAFAVGRAAWLVSGNARAGAVAALLFALIPQTKLAIGEALPDGAYMAAWALALWAAVALDRKPALRSAAGLGLALAAVVLSRTFGWALVAGVLAWSLEPARRARLWPLLVLPCAIVAAGYAPFLAWNAAHGWENFGFSFHTRQRFRAFAHLADASTIRFIIYSALLAVLTWFVALRREPRVTLVAWTALPLPAALLVLSFVTTTESYWIIGPAASVALGAGIMLERSLLCTRIALGALGIGTAYVTAAALFVALPEGAQAQTFANVPALKKPFASGVFVYAPLTQRLRALSAADHDAIVLTDRYETSAEMLWNGVDSRIVVALPQQAQWMRWHAGLPVPKHALLVTFNAPMAASPELAREAATAFARVTPTTPIALTFAGTPQDVYYVEQLDDVRAGAGAVMVGL